MSPRPSEKRSTQPDQPSPIGFEGGPQFVQSKKVSRKVSWHKTMILGWIFDAKEAKASISHYKFCKLWAFWELWDIKQNWYQKRFPKRSKSTTLGLSGQIFEILECFWKGLIFRWILVGKKLVPHIKKQKIMCLETTGGSRAEAKEGGGGR